jgi:hypothetical protein
MHAAAMKPVRYPAGSCELAAKELVAAAKAAEDASGNCRRQTVQSDEIVAKRIEGGGVQSI